MKSKLVVLLAAAAAFSLAAGLFVLGGCACSSTATSSAPTLSDSASSSTASSASGASSSAASSSAASSASSSSEAEVAVPNIVGKPRDEAQKAITDAKLKFDLTIAYDNNVPKGAVVSQSVAAGTKVKTGSTVCAVVSGGPKPQNPPAADVVVPNLAGRTWNEAKSVLKSAGLSASYTGDTSGHVTSQDVAAGTKVAPGTTVTVHLEAEGDPGQNPVMNFIGKYGSGRATVLVEPSGKSNAKITVNWSSSASETSEWVMSGAFDEHALTVNYKNCVRKDYVYNSDGKVESEKTVYKGGTGTITFSDASLTWKDNKEGVADGMTFTYAS